MDRAASRRRALTRCLTQLINPVYNLRALDAAVEYLYVYGFPASPMSSLSAPAARRAHAAVPIGRERRRNSAVTGDARELVTPVVRGLLEQFRLEDIVSHLLRRTHFFAEELFAQEFADESLTPRQKAALIMVYQNPGLNQNALADRLFMDRNTVAEMVKRLVAADLLARRAARDDQRAYELCLAPAGAELLNRVMPRDANVERRLLERLPEEYRPLFVKCLRMLVDPAHPRDQA